MWAVYTVGVYADLCPVYTVFGVLLCPSLGGVSVHGVYTQLCSGVPNVWLTQDVFPQCLLKVWDKRADTSRHTQHGGHTFLSYARPPTTERNTHHDYRTDCRTVYIR